MPRDLPGQSLGKGERMYRITELARGFGLSRSTLIYYDRVGILSPSGRSEAGYRLYSEADRERLEAVSSFRKAGLSIEEIGRILADARSAERSVLQRRLQAVGEEIKALQAQQRLLARMLQVQSEGELPDTVDKATWVEMLRAAGMDDEAMEQWHAEFERRAPQAHHAFLLSLGISEQEALLIRHWSGARSGKEDAMKYFYDIFERMPRQAPGSAEETRRALELLGPLPEKPRVLDIGCGSGAPTMALARAIDGEITALDNHPPFLELLREKAEREGVGEKITCRHGSMLELDFAAGSLDLIWAEGSLYLMGFERALRELRGLLSPGGSLACTELTWLTADRPERAREFWGRDYPAMRDIEENCALARECGYQVVGQFTLPSQAWEEEFYRPLQLRLAEFAATHRGDPEAAAVVAQFEAEIELYRSCGESYGYVFYLLRRPE